ncbi:MAG: chromate resistance protein [Actinobacteria bacterium]|nr:chromate resistance protein [Actinomycetota bacterium]
MKWVTRERPKTDRIACPWLIKKFIDDDAEFLYVPATEVLEIAKRKGAHSFDAPGARYTHRDGVCSFEVLVEEYGLDDPALALLARIVHGADVPEDRDATPQSRGLLAIAEGFYLLDLDDHRQLDLSLPVYDALYAWCQAEVGVVQERA